MSSQKAGIKLWLKAGVHTGLRSGWLVSLLAVIMAFLLGAILLLIVGVNVPDAYYAMFRGAIFDPEAATMQRQIKPLTDSFFYAIPLIIAGLGLGFGFRAGLFNIGGAGQLIMGALAAIWVAFSYELPAGLHVLVAILAAMVAGALYAGVAGVLRARTGANEVIVTIMLNSIAMLALAYLLAQDAWHRPGSNQPITPVTPDSASFSAILPPPFKLHFGLVIAVLAVILYWWVLERSKFGFELRAVGANPHAARTAGISISRVIIVTMLFSGAFLGVAGANEALGTIGYVSSGIAGSVGFDAITVALLGRNKPLGIFFAGLLFGAFKAGGFIMQTKGVPIDMILILQASIVLLIAAPPLIRFIFRLPKPDQKSMREYITLQQEQLRGAEVQR